MGQLSFSGTCRRSSRFLMRQKSSSSYFSDVTKIAFELCVCVFRFVVFCDGHCWSMGWGGWSSLRVGRVGSSLRVGWGHTHCGSVGENLIAIRRGGVLIAGRRRRSSLRVIRGHSHFGSVGVILIAGRWDGVLIAGRCELHLFCCYNPFVSFLAIFRTF